MASKSVLFIVATILPIISATSVASPLLGGWSPITNPNEADIVDIGRFAVEAHNLALTNTTGNPLTFFNVESGESQVVAGMNYHLFIKAKINDGGSSDVHVYEAFVWVKAWMNFIKLTSFKICA